MSFGSIELTTISRAQDFTTIKHNEDNKAFVDQTNISQQSQRTNEQRSRTVNESDDVEWHNKQPDAKEKGNNEYAGDGGKNRRKEEKKEEDRVVIKGSMNFDMKV